MSNRPRNPLLPALMLAGAVAFAAPAHALDTLTVQMAFYPQGPQAYLFLAKEKGWYKKAGLDVEMLDGRGSNYSMQVVSSGHADVGEGQLAPLASALEKGAHVKAVAEWFKKDGPAVIVPLDSGITSPKGLKGKKVVLIATGPWPALLDPFLGRFGLKQSDLSLLYVNAPALFASYAKHASDSMLTVDLAFSEANPLRPSRLMSVADYGIRLPGDGLYVTDETLSKKKDALVRFIRESARALNYIYAGHEDEAVAAIRKERPNIKLTVERLRFQVGMYKSRRSSTSTEGKPAGWQSPADWKERIDFMEKAGLLKKPHKPSDFFTNAIIDAASK